MGWSEDVRGLVNFHQQWHLCEAQHCGNQVACKVSIKNSTILLTLLGIHDKQIIAMDPMDMSHEIEMISMFYLSWNAKCQITRNAGFHIFWGFPKSWMVFVTENSMSIQNLGVPLWLRKLPTLQVMEIKPWPGPSDLQWQPAPWPSQPTSPHPREPLGCPCVWAAPSRSASRCPPGQINHTGKFVMLESQLRSIVSGVSGCNFTLKQVTYHGISLFFSRIWTCFSINSISARFISSAFIVSSTTQSFKCTIYEKSGSVLL